MLSTSVAKTDKRDRSHNSHHSHHSHHSNHSHYSHQSHRSRETSRTDSTTGMVVSGNNNLDHHRYGLHTSLYGGHMDYHQLNRLDHTGHKRVNAALLESSHNQQHVYPQQMGTGSTGTGNMGTAHMMNVNPNDKDAVMLEYNYKDGRFLFHDKNRSFLGSFTGDELIKYVISPSVPEFLVNVNASASREIIEKFICTMDAHTGVSIKNHLESPFTGHVEMLIKLYKQIEDFEQTRLEQELGRLSRDNKAVAHGLFYDFMYHLLTHTLKIIAVLTEIVKSHNNRQLNDKLLKYSVAIMYKISTINKSEVDRRLKTMDSIMAERSKLQSIKTTLNEKIDKLEKVIMAQSDQIDYLVRSGQTNSHHGGDRQDTTTSVTELSTTAQNGFYSSSSEEIDTMDNPITMSTALSDIISASTGGSKSSQRSSTRSVSRSNTTTNSKTTGSMSRTSSTSKTSSTCNNTSNRSTSNISNTSNANNSNSNSTAPSNNNASSSGTSQRSSHGSSNGETSANRRASTLTISNDGTDSESEDDNDFDLSYLSSIDTTSVNKVINI